MNSILLLILTLALFATPSSLQAAEKFELKGTNSATIRNTVFQDEVVGHTYLTLGQYAAPGTLTCKKAVEEISEQLIDVPLLEKIAYYDFIIGCAPSGANNTIFAEILFEPQRAADASVVDQYMAKRQDLKWQNIVFRFSKVRSIEIVKSVESKHFVDTRQQKWDFASRLGGAPEVSFSSFYTYRLHIADELAGFRNTDIEVLLKHLEKHYGFQAVAKFRDDALIKSNYISSHNPRTFVIEGGTKISAGYADGAYRDCTRFSKDLCY